MVSEVKIVHKGLRLKEEGPCAHVMICSDSCLLVFATIGTLELLQFKDDDRTMGEV